MMVPVLRIENLTKTFKQGEKTLNVLKGVNLSLEAGSLTAIVGSSGSGKSTFLQIAGLLDAPSSGSVFIEGADYSEKNDRERTAARSEKLGFIYQFHHLLPDFTALENTSLAGRIQKQTAVAATREAKFLLSEMGLAERLDHPPSRLSGGEQQRVAIARALMGSPALLLADEPTGNLDDATSSRVFDHLMHIVRSKGLTALIATHDRQLAADADRLFELKDGILTAL